MTFHPTSDATGYPTACYCCGRHANGIGIGTPGARNPAERDPKNLCEECTMILAYIKQVRNFNGYERAAVKSAVVAVTPIIMAKGTDLAEWEEEDVEDFCRAVWVACGDGLRAAIRSGEVPF
jgi:hypothetical protein